MHLSLAIVVAVVVTSACDGFLFDVKFDCLLSPWSTWTDIPGLGARVRERAILRHENKGGLSCPQSRDLRQIKVNPVPPPTTPPQYQNPQQQIAHQMAQQVKVINATAHSMVHNFVRRSVNVHQHVPGQNNGQVHFRDLLIILDASASIGDENFARAKRSLSKLLKTLCPEPDPFDPRYHHAALIVYSTTVMKAFDFRTHDSTNAIQNAIENAPYLSGTTCTTDAFDAALNMLSSQYYGMRPDSNIDKEVLILTDGQSNCGEDILTAAENLRQKARVFALLIGDATEQGLEEMTGYVSAPVPNHLFALKGYREFDDLIQLLQQQAQQVPCVPLDVPVQP